MAGAERLLLAMNQGEGTQEPVLLGMSGLFGLLPDLGVLCLFRGGSPTPVTAP